MFLGICMFCKSLSVLLYCFILAIMLSVLLIFTDSDYLFVIFKFFKLTSNVRFEVKCQEVTLMTKTSKVKCMGVKFKIFRTTELSYLDQKRVNLSMVYVTRKHGRRIPKNVISCLICCQI